MTTIERALHDVGLDGSTLERNKQLAREIVDRIFVQQDEAALDELIAQDFVPHTFGPMPPGRDGLREGMRRAGAGVSDAEFVIHDLIAEGDQVAVRLTTSARHTGTFMGIEPTGKRYSIDEIHIFRIRDGQLAEHWHEFDKASLMAQLRGEPKQAAPSGAAPGSSAQRDPDRDRPEGDERRARDPVDPQQGAR
jgi:predicted ester cyclase